MAADTAELIEHVKDAEAFHFPWGWKWEIPQPPEWMGFHVTKFMVLEAVAAVVLVAIFIPLARRIATGERPRGAFWNVFEAMLLFLRDEVARPAIGRTQGDRFLPFLWTSSSSSCSAT